MNFTSSLQNVRSLSIVHLVQSFSLKFYGFFNIKSISSLRWKIKSFKVEWSWKELSWKIWAQVTAQVEDIFSTMKTPEKTFQLRSVHRFNQLLDFKNLIYQLHGRSSSTSISKNRQVGKSVVGKHWSLNNRFQTQLANYYTHAWPR